MNVAGQNVLDAEAFGFFAPAQSVTDAVRLIHRSALYDRRTMEAVAARTSSGGPPKTILGQRYFRVAKVHQAIGHLHIKGKSTRHGESLAIAGHDFIGEIHQASALGVDGAPFIREFLHR